MSRIIWHIATSAADVEPVCLSHLECVLVSETEWQWELLPVGGQGKSSEQCLSVRRDWDWSEIAVLRVLGSFRDWGDGGHFPLDTGGQGLVDQCRKWSRKCWRADSEKPSWYRYLPIFLSPRYRRYRCRYSLLQRSLAYSHCLFFTFHALRRRFRQYHLRRPFCGTLSRSNGHFCHMHVEYYVVYLSLDVLCLEIVCFC